MGYYTHFKITVPKEAGITEEILEKASGGYGFEEYKDGTFVSADNYKWYEHTEDMKKLSADPKYKDIVFTVEGEGEEAGDVWKAYYKNGKSVTHRVEFVFPDFKDEDLE